MTLRIYDAKTKIKTSIHNGQLEYAIYTNAKARLVEDRSSIDLSRTQNILKVEGAVSARIKQSIQSFIDNSIKTNTDPALLGAYVWRTSPYNWERYYRENWPAGMKDARFSIQVNCQLSDTGLIYQNVTEGRSGK